MSQTKETQHDGQCELLTASDSMLLSGHYTCGCEERARRLRDARGARAYMRYAKQNGTWR